MRTCLFFGGFHHSKNTCMFGKKGTSTTKSISTKAQCQSCRPTDRSISDFTAPPELICHPIPRQSAPPLDSDTRRPRRPRGASSSVPTRDSWRRSCRAELRPCCVHVDGFVGTRLCPRFLHPIEDRTEETKATVPSTTTTSRSVHVPLADRGSHISARGRSKLEPLAR